MIRKSGHGDFIAQLSWSIYLIDLSDRIVWSIQKKMIELKRDIYYFKLTGALFSLIEE